jgi:hypothetical protein
VLVTCTQCGKELPREDARFCSNCGALLASQSSRPELPLSQASNPPVSPSSVPQGSRQEYKHVLREQVAHQPRPARLTRDISSENNAPSVPSPQSSERERPELSVRVWDQEIAQEQAHMSIDDLPTQETPASPLASPKAVPLSPTPFLGIQGVQSVQQSLADPEATHIVQRGSHNDYERFIAPPQSAGRAVNSPSSPSFPDRSQSIPDQPTQANSVPVLPTVPPTPVLYNGPTSSSLVQQSVPVEPLKPAPLRPLSLVPRIPPPTVRRGPGPLVLLGVIVLTLIIASIAWVTIAQPFNVPSVTQPLQSYRDTHLGIALSYPSDWILTHNASSVLFSDSSQTAQAAITVLSTSNAPSGNVAAYLQKQATKLGMTGAKTVTTVSFAGATWQQMQGGVQKSGVNDTETLFATIHNNQLFTLAQTAPQSVYADEERVIFSKMRASLQLL